MQRADHTSIVKEMIDPGAHVLLVRLPTHRESGGLPTGHLYSAMSGGLALAEGLGLSPRFPIFPLSSMTGG